MLHQLNKQLDAHRNGLFVEIKAGVMVRILAVFASHPYEQEGTGLFLQVIGKILAPHDRFDIGNTFPAKLPDGDFCGVAAHPLIVDHGRRPPVHDDFSVRSPRRAQCLDRLLQLTGQQLSGLLGLGTQRPVEHSLVRNDVVGRARLQPTNGDDGRLDRIYPPGDDPLHSRDHLARDIDRINRLVRHRAVPAPARDDDSHIVG